MKQLLYIAFAAACFSMAGCSNDEPSMPVTTENDFESADGQLVIQLGALNVPQAAITRSPIDGDDISKLTELGIFAVGRGVSLNKNDLTNWYDDNNSVRNILLGNAKATGTNLNAYDNTVHTGLKRISFYVKGNGADDWTGTTGAVYYYPMKIVNNYDFYGYYPRQATNNITVTSNAINVPFTITGDEDIIYGKAPQAPHKDANTLYTDEEGKMVHDAIDGYNARYIRMLKYHNWLIETKGLDGTKEKYVPNIKFNHLLTRLNFQVITAKEQSGEVSPVPGTEGVEPAGPANDRAEAKNLRVTDIKIKNVLTTPTLNVLTGDLTWAGASRDLPMISENTENPSVWKESKIVPQEYQDGEITYPNAGHLMVQPGLDSYKITLKVHAPSTTGGIPTVQDVELTLDNADHNKFKAGYAYNIRIALYAMQQVFASAELTEWATDANSNVYLPVE